MADFLVFIVVIIILVNAAGSKNKKAKSKGRAQVSQPAQATRKPQPARRQPSPEMQKRYREMFDLPDDAFGDIVTPAETDEAVRGHAEVKVKAEIAPRVRTTVQTRVTSVADEDGLYSGSMNAVTTEGEDPCHEHELNAGPAPAAVLTAAPETPGWSPDLTPSAMMNAIVMSEVLGRPVSRRR